MAPPPAEAVMDEPPNGDVQRYLPHQEAALRCGVPALQGCATMRLYTFNLAVIYLGEIAFATYVIGSYRTLEKRFDLSSAEVGALNTITDAVQVVSVLFIGYFGRNAHKPRVMSVSVTFYVIGALLYAMPYFLFGSKEVMKHGSMLNGTDASFADHTCRAINHSDACSVEDMAEGTHQTAYNLIAMACVCLGIGGSCIRVMGFTYIDENVRASDTPLYVGLLHVITYAAGLAGMVIPVGPILGFLLAAVCTGLPENLRDSELSPEDPGYIGAWWLGFIIIGSLVVVSSIPMFFFPKHLPQYYEEKWQREKKTKIDVENINGKTDVGIDEKKPAKGEKLLKVQGEIKGFLHSTWRLVSNSTLVMFTLHSVFDILVMLGLAANATRYMEIQFNLPAFQANIVTAISLAVPSIFGNVLGGVIMKRMNLGVIGASVINTATSAVIVVTLAISMGLGCDQINVAGTINEKSIDVGLVCNQNCSCTLEAFLPVCADGHLNYLSPCHAGCSAMENATHYSDCACVPESVVAGGLCDQACPLVTPYIIMVIITCFSISLARVPTVVVNLRIVEPELKSFSIGIVSFADNLLGFIPAPILFGALVDSACILWQEACGRQGACLLYDKAHYRISVNGVCLAFQVLSLFFAVLTLLLVKRDVVNGKYENLEGDDSNPKNNNLKHNQMLKGKENAGFESDAGSLFRRPSTDQGQEWWLDDTLVPTPFKELEMMGRSTCRRHAIVGDSDQCNFHLKKADSVSCLEAQKQDDLSEDRDISSVMQAAIEHALRLLTVTHHYVMDILKMSGEYSADALRPKVDIPEMAADVLETGDIFHQQAVSTEKDHKVCQIPLKVLHAVDTIDQKQSTFLSNDVDQCDDQSSHKSLHSDESTLKAHDESSVANVSAARSSAEFLSVCFPADDICEQAAHSEDADNPGSNDCENVTILAGEAVPTLKVVSEPSSPSDNPLDGACHVDRPIAVPVFTVETVSDGICSRSTLTTPVHINNVPLDNSLSDIEEEKETDETANASQMLQIEARCNSTENEWAGGKQLSLPSGAILPDAVSDNSVA